MVLRSIGRRRNETAGATTLQPREKARNHRDLDGVGKADPECAVGGGGIERLALEHRRLDLGERDPHRIGERKRARCRPHAFGAARQQLIAKQRAQPREIVAHRRLAKPNAGRRARNAALRQQSIERDQQIEVEPA